MKQEKPFYTALPESQLKVNTLLDLPASGEEYSWEFELADASKLDVMCQHLESGQYDIEDRSALALLAVASIEEAVDQGSDVSGFVSRLQRVFQNDDDLQVRMVSFWIDQGNAEHTDMAITLLME